MPKLVGINHIALEVGNLDEALAFWESIFGPLELRGRGGGMAFIDMGDQFIALAQSRAPSPTTSDTSASSSTTRKPCARDCRELGVPVYGRGLDFRDPWGNQIQVVDYRDIQFTKTDSVLQAMGLDGLEKSESARGNCALKA